MPELVLSAWLRGRFSVTKRPAPEVAVEELDPETKVYAKAMRHYFNPKLLGCEVEGKAGVVNVRVRDASFYRAGERFAVKMNDVGRQPSDFIKHPTRADCASVQARVNVIGRQKMDRYAAQGKC